MLQYVTGYLFESPNTSMRFFRHCFLRRKGCLNSEETIERPHATADQMGELGDVVSLHAGD